MCYGKQYFSFRLLFLPIPSFMNLSRTARSGTPDTDIDAPCMRTICCFDGPISPFGGCKVHEEIAVIARLWT